MGVGKYLGMREKQSLRERETKCEREKKKRQREREQGKREINRM